MNPYQTIVCGGGTVRNHGRFSFGAEQRSDAPDRAMRFFRRVIDERARLSLDVVP